MLCPSEPRRALPRRGGRTGRHVEIPAARAAGPQRYSVRGVHFVIMGCGRVGATLAQSFEASGHSVAIVDQNPDAFRRLPAEFTGKKVTGVGFDRDTLVQAGIEDAYAFAAVSDGDNSNILSARVVRETFGVEKVVARIYDPQRAEIYERLGIPTVATVRWTADQVLRRMLPLGATDEYRDPSGQVRLAQLDFHPDWVGRTVRAIEEATGARVAFVGRFGDGKLVTERTVLQENDELHVLMTADGTAAVERVLTHAPKVEAE
jgi:trk system potassium uptake protein TrkA